MATKKNFKKSSKSRKSRKSNKNSKSRKTKSQRGGEPSFPFTPVQSNIYENASLFGTPVATGTAYKIKTTQQSPPNYPFRNPFAPNAIKNKFNAKQSAKRGKF